LESPEQQGLFRVILAGVRHVDLVASRARATHYAYRSMKTKAVGTRPPSRARLSGHQRAPRSLTELRALEMLGKSVERFPAADECRARCAEIMFRFDPDRRKIKN
jgi:hypothetical protein